MQLKKMGNKVLQKGESTYKKINYLAKVERIIATALTSTPFILYWTDLGWGSKLRDSISNYAYMGNSYWFGSLLALAGALFIFNGAQHMFVKDMADLAAVEKRFGKGYNIIFGIALFGVIYFDHETFTVAHYICAGVFYIGCALAMIFTKEKPLTKLGDVLGVLTLVSLVVHFVLNWIFGESDNPFTLLWAEWVGLICIAVYFFMESRQRDQREKEKGIAPKFF